MKTFLVIIFCCFELIVGAQMRANYELAEKSAGMFYPGVVIRSSLILFPEVTISGFIIHKTEKISFILLM